MQKRFFCAAVSQKEDKVRSVIQRFLIALVIVMIGCSAAFAQGGAQIIKSKKLSVPIDYPNHPKTRGQILDLWIWDFKNPGWKKFSFTNKVKNNFMDPWDGRQFVLHFGKLGYGDGLYGILIQGQKQPKPTSSQLVRRRVLIDQIPPKVTVRIQNPQLYYKGGGEIELDLKVIETQAKDLTVEIKSGTAGGWVTLPLPKGTKPKSGKVTVTLPQRSAKQNVLRVTVTDGVNWSDSVETSSFGIDADPPLLRITRLELDPNDPKSSTVLVHWGHTKGLTTLQEVQFYWTSDGGAIWTPGEVRKAPDPTKPFVFEAGEKGEYGFIIIGKDAVGNENPKPTSGTRPKPQAMISVQPKVETIGANHRPADEINLVKREGEISFSYKVPLDLHGKVVYVELFTQVEKGKWRSALQSPKIGDPLPYLGEDGKVGVVVVLHTNRTRFDPFLTGPLYATEKFDIDRTRPVIAKFDIQRESIGSMRLSPLTIKEISWEVTDANFPQNPVELYYTYMEKGATRVYPIRAAKAYPAAGKISWRIPEVPEHEFNLKLVARDKHNNLAEKTIGRFYSINPGDVPGNIVGPRTATSHSVRIVPNDRFRMEIARDDTIEIWYRPPGGKWSKSTLPGTSKSPYPMKFLRDGEYELALKALRSGGTSFEPSIVDIKILVDSAKPQLSFDPPPVSSDGEYIGPFRLYPTQIRWSCTDASLGNRPITIEFSRDGGAKWKFLRRPNEPTLTSLVNTGQFDWSRMPQEDLSNCYVRITATDLAGNTRVVTSPSFRIDSQVPITKIIGNEPGKTYKIIISARDMGGSGMRDIRLFVNRSGQQEWRLLEAECKRDPVDRSKYTFSFPVKKDETGKTGFYLVPTDRAGNSRKIPTIVTEYPPDRSFVIDVSVKPFAIKAPFDGSTPIKGGMKHRIEWHAPLSERQVLVSISFYDGDNWTPLLSGKQNLGYAVIEIPGISRDGCKLRLKPSGKDPHITRPFIVDSTPPMITPDVKPEPGQRISRITSNSRDVKIRYRAVDRLTPVRKVFVFMRPFGKANEDWRNTNKNGSFWNSKQEVTVNFFGDGDYDIFFTAEDIVRNRKPDPARGARAQVRLTIDTDKPTAELTNLDERKIYKSKEQILYRVRYSDPGGEFLPDETVLEIAPAKTEHWTLIQSGLKSEGEYPFNAPLDPGPYEVRLTVTDICGNKAFRADRIEVKGGTPEIRFPLLSPLLRGGEEVKIPYDVSRRSRERPVTFEFRERSTLDWTEISQPLKHSGTFIWKAPMVNAAKAQMRLVVTDSQREIFHSEIRTFAIDRDPPIVRPNLHAPGEEIVKKSAPVTIPIIPYRNTEIGPAKIKFIELFVSDDGCRTWQLLDTINDIRKSFTFKRNEEGRYFFYSRAIDELRRGEPAPGHGAKEHARLFIDKTPPRVSDVRVGYGRFDMPQRRFPVWVPIPISWAYYDERPTSRPITIEYTDDLGTSWHVIARNVRNTGRFIWHPEVEGGRKLKASKFYQVRVTGVDLARNEASDTTGSFGLIIKGPDVSVDPPPGPWFSKDTSTWIPIKVEGREIEITQLILYYRRIGEPKWMQYDQIASPDVQRIRFEMEAGTYELLLKAYFQVGRRTQGRGPAPPPPLEVPQAILTHDPVPPTVSIISGFSRKPLAFKRGEVEDLRWAAEDDYLAAIHLELSEDGGASWNRILGNENLIKSRNIGVPLRYPSGRFYKLRVIARDKAGNVAYEPTDAFSIDGSPPVVEVFAKQKLQAKNTFRFKIRPIGDVKDLERIDLYVRRKGEPWKLVQSYNSIDSPIEYTAPKYGKYSVIAVGIDHLGNTEHMPLPGDPGELEFSITRWLKITLQGFEDELNVYQGGTGYKIYWRCNETDLVPSPISFWYKTSPAGEWARIEGQQFANSGYADLVFPKIDEKRVWFRVQAVDRQGSLGWDDMEKPIEIKSTPPETTIGVGVVPRRRDEIKYREEDTTPEKPGEGKGEQVGPTKKESEKPPKKKDINYVERGKDLLSKEFYDEARKMFLLAIQNKKQRGTAYYGLALAHRHLGSDDSTLILYFERALEFFPSNAPCLNDLGAVHFSRGDYTKAAKYFEKAIQLSPSAIFSTNLGKAYYQLGEYKDAGDALNRALRVDSKYWEAYWFKGLIYRRGDDFHAERDMWNKILELIDPDSEWGRKAQGYLRSVEEKIKNR
ncbi:MAG: tetratricopeptide repeat protein [Planctomycetota bacterium]|nr:MAG: tetratricopeptide repeat protein [Planctomycetota bacterium]